MHFELIVLSLSTLPLYFVIFFLIKFFVTYQKKKKKKNNYEGKGSSKKKKKEADNFSTGLGESLRSGYVMTNDS